MIVTDHGNVWGSGKGWYRQHTAADTGSDYDRGWTISHLAQFPSFFSLSLYFFFAYISSSRYPGRIHLHET